MLGWLFGKKGDGSQQSPRRIKLDGDGSYSQEIVGESFYQSALEQIAGPKTEGGKELLCVAVLICESDNPHDENAVAVTINGKKVGHLSRDDAVSWRRMLKKRLGCLPEVELDAVIVGGWDDGISEGHYGVKLDLG